MKTIVVVFMYVMCNFSCLANIDSVKLSPAQMQEDLRTLKAVWQNAHPGLYRYNSPEQLKDHFDEAFARTSKPMSLRKFFILLSQLNVKLRCGHTFVSFYNQKQKLEDDMFSRIHLPILFRVVDQRVIVTHNLTDDNSLNPGTEIQMINGVPVKQIIDSLLTVSKSDGNNGLNKKLDNISIYPIDISTQKYTLFDIFFPLFFKKSINDPLYSVKANTSVGKQRLVAIDGVSKQERETLFNERYGTLPRAEKSWYVRELNSKCVVLRVGDFAVYNWKFNFEHFLDSVFRSFAEKNYENLVVDIRQNEGGSDDARDELVAYLIKGKIGCTSNSRRLYASLSIPDSLQRFLKTWDPEFKRPKPADRYQKTSEGYYEGKYDKIECDSLSPKANNFKGRVFLLTDVTNSSTTFIMADIFKSNKLGTIVGETTGGTQQGINGGQILFLYLPNSSIEMDIPLIYQAPHVEKPDEGIHPDIKVKTTRIDIASGRDPQVDTILRRFLHPDQSKLGAVKR